MKDLGAITVVALALGLFIALGVLLAVGYVPAEGFSHHASHDRLYSLLFGLDSGLILAGLLIFGDRK